jgi:hypothetical protein
VKGFDIQIKDSYANKLGHYPKNLNDYLFIKKQLVSPVLSIYKYRMMV